MGNSIKAFWVRVSRRLHGDFIQNFAKVRISTILFDSNCYEHICRSYLILNTITIIQSQVHCEISPHKSLDITKKCIALRPNTFSLVHFEWNTIQIQIMKQLLFHLLLRKFIFLKYRFQNLCAILYYWIIELYKFFELTVVHYCVHYFIWQC